MNSRIKEVLNNLKSAGGLHLECRNEIIGRSIDFLIDKKAFLLFILPLPLHIHFLESDLDMATNLAYLVMAYWALLFAKYHQKATSLFLGEDIEAKYKLLPNNRESLLVFIAISFIPLIVITQTVPALFAGYPMHDLKISGHNSDQTISGSCNHIDNRIQFIGYNCTLNKENISSDLTLMFKWYDIRNKKITSTSNKTIDTNKASFILINPDKGQYSLEAETNTNISLNISNKNNWSNVNNIYVVSYEDKLEESHRSNVLIFNLVVVLAFSLSGLQLMIRLRDDETISNEFYKAGLLWTRWTIIAILSITSILVYFKLLIGGM